MTAAISATSAKSATSATSTIPITPSRFRRFAQFPLTRIVLAIFITALSVGLTMSLASSLADKAHRIMWPELLGAGAALLSYAIYVRLMEKRPVVELSRAGAISELGAGLLIGVLMVVSVIGMLAVFGAYQVTGSDVWSIKIIAPIAEMTLVGVLEEILGRGIIFRIVEKTLGSWLALVISALLFGLAHVPGSSAGVLAIAITVVAGAFFALAYMATRRLWLCIGIHIAWNYTLGTIFSVAVSGHKPNGLLHVQLTGADWLTGGAYGLEASLLTLLVLVVIGATLLHKAQAKENFVAPFWRAKR